MMVVGHGSDLLDVASYKYVLAGGLSGAATRAVCQPFDVLKIRFQLQVESFEPRGGGKYQGLVQGVSTICREEGLRALWKGHVPAQSLSVTYGCVQFYMFEIFSKHLSSLYSISLLQVPSDFACGVLSSSIGTVASFPFDVIRTRLVAQGNNTKTYSGTVNAFLLMCRESPRQLFRGLTPAILQVAPQGGIQFTVYNILSRLFCLSSYLSSPDLKSSGPILTPLGTVAAGCMAGLASKLAIYPLDLAKKRIQVQGFERSEFGEAFKCRNLVDCLCKIYAKESWRGLYKGLSPSLLKAAVTSACHFTFYEHSLRLLS